MDRVLQGVRKALAGFLALIMLTQPLLTFGESSLTFAQNSQFSGSVNVVGSTDLADQYVSRSGAFVYSIDIDSPTGVKGMEPGLGMSYSSQNKNNHTTYGYGWSDNVPYIERDNLTGLNNIYDEFNFISSQHGKLTSTSTTGYGTYVPRGSSSVARYEYLSGNVWKMYTVEGMVYTYGSDTNSRLDDSNDISRIYRWYLERVEDTNGNYISYSYDKQLNQIYLDNINYSGYGSVDGIYDIKFNYSTSTAFSNYFPGFNVVTDRVVDSVDVMYQSNVIKQYDFDYSMSPNSGRSLLDSVQQHSWNNGQRYTLPKTEFTYTESDLSFTLENNFTQISLEAETGDEIFENFRTSIPVTYIDDNHDGILEIHGAYSEWDGDHKEFINWWNPKLEQWEGGRRVHSWPAEAVLRRGTHRLLDTNADSQVETFRVLGNGGDAGRIYDTDGGYFYGNGSRTKFGDINGDGLTDIIAGRNGNDGGVWFNIPGSSWQKAKTSHGWNNLADYVDYGGNALYIDINNDGLADRISRGCNGGCKMRLLINKGDNGQWDKKKWSDLPAGPVTSKDSADAYMFNDINGDGLLDILISSNTQTSIYIQDISGAFTLQTLNLTLPHFAEEYDDEFLSQAVWFYDMNGDGLDDVFIPREGETKVYWNNSESVDRLVSVDTSSGASIETSYERTTELYNSDGTLKNPSLTTPLDVATSISVDDGLGNIQETEYDYYDGLLIFVSHDKKRLGGFGRIEKTDSQTGLQTITYYHQGNGDDKSSNESGDQYEKIGKPYYVVVSDSGTGDIVTESFNQWDTITLSGGSELTVLDQSVNREYEIGTTDYKESATSHTYSTEHGQVLEKTEWGEVSYNESTDTVTDINTDKRTKQYQYTAADHPMEVPPNQYTVSYLASDIRHGNASTGQPGDPDVTGHSASLRSSNWRYGNETYYSSSSNRVTFERALLGFDISSNSLLEINDNVTEVSLVQRTKEVYSAWDHSFKIFNGQCALDPNDVAASSAVTCSTTDTEWSDMSNNMSSYPPTGHRKVISINLHADAFDEVVGSVDSSNLFYLVTKNSLDADKTMPTRESQGGEISWYGHAEGWPLLYVTFEKEVLNQPVFYRSVQATVYDYNNAVVRDTRMYYDNQPHGQIGSTGDMTTQSVWLDTDNSWIDTDYTHNAVGLPLTVTDARGNTTTNTYNVYNLFPQTTTNELGHTSTNEYDYSVGKITKTTDPNGVVSENIYDGFGRVIEKKQSIPAGGMFTVETYAYDDTSMPRSATSAIYHTAAPQYQYSYTDGLGRTLQTKTLTSNGNYNTVTYAYNNAGQLASQTLPYVNNINAYESTIPSGVNETTYTYDVAGRTTDTSSPMGKYSVAYGAWDQVVTNRNNIDTTQTYDAFGNLVQVIENIKGISASSITSTSTSTASTTTASTTPSYQYKKQLTITGQSGAGAGYQVLVKVGMNSSVSGSDVHTEGNAQFFPTMKNDGGDLAFYDDTETELLPFWVEKVENDVAYVWVQVLDDLDTNQDIYLYYGHSSPTNYSDGVGTFPYFEDMLTDPGVTKTGGEHYQIGGTFTDLDTYAVHMKQDIPGYSMHKYGSAIHYLRGHQDTPYGNIMTVAADTDWNSYGPGVALCEGDGTATCSTKTALTSSIVDLVIKEDDANMTSYIDGVQHQQHLAGDFALDRVEFQGIDISNAHGETNTWTYDDSADTLQISATRNDTNQNITVRFYEIFVRKYQTNEPTIQSVGGEEGIARVSSKYARLASASSTTDLGDPAELEELSTGPEEVFELVAKDTVFENIEKATAVAEEINEDKNIDTQTKISEEEIVIDEEDLTYEGNTNTTAIENQETPSLIEEENTGTSSEVVDVVATTTVIVEELEAVVENQETPSLIEEENTGTSSEVVDVVATTTVIVEELEAVVEKQEINGVALETEEVPEKISTATQKADIVTEEAPVDEEKVVEEETITVATSSVMELLDSETSTQTLAPVDFNLSKPVQVERAIGYMDEIRLARAQGLLNDKEVRALELQRKIDVKKQVVSNLNSKKTKHENRVEELDTTIEKRISQGRDIVGQQSNRDKQMVKIDKTIVQIDGANERIATLQETLSATRNDTDKNITVRFHEIFVRPYVANEPTLDFAAAEQSLSGWSRNNGGSSSIATSSPAITQYFYDTQNQLVKVIDAENNEREFEYDSLGRQISSELSHNSASTSATFTYEYDSVGNKTKETRPDGSVINYTYDYLNRVLKIDNPTEGKGAEVNYRYDSGSNMLGHLNRIAGSGYVRVLRNNKAGLKSLDRLKINGVNHDTRYRYTNHGKLRVIKYPDNLKILHVYNIAGELDKLRRNTGNGYVDVVNIDYNHIGQIVSQDYANGISTSYTYADDLEYLLENRVTKNGTSTLENISYQYDNVGNITHIDNTGVVSPYVKQYSYDSVDRLQTATTSDTLGTSTDVYTYSLTGNILTHNNEAYSYTNGTFPQAATAFAGNTYAYDANGNLSSKDDGSVLSTYSYDWNDRLSSVDQGSDNLGTYTYTEARQRLSKTVGASTKYYINNNVEYDGDYNNHVFAGANRVLTSNVDGLHYTHKDQLQSTSLTTDSSGIVEEAVDYYPFGSERNRTGTHESNYTYTDQYFDDETALLYMNARYYDPELKRFTSVDDYVTYSPQTVMRDPQQLNAYTYVKNNPMNYVDPTGQLTIATHGTKAESDDEGYSDSSQIDQMAADLGDEGNGYRFRWNGNNNIEDRQIAADELMALINGYEFADGEQLNFIGHSHGGNVNILAANQIDRDVNNMILLGTPNRSDYQINTTRVKNTYNVYSPDDGIQLKGGPWSQHGRTMGRTRLMGTNLQVHYAKDPGWIDAHSLLKSRSVWNALVPFIR